MAICSDNIGRV